MNSGEEPFLIMADKMSFFTILALFPVVTSQVLCPEAEGFFPDPFLPDCHTYILCNDFVPLRAACPRGWDFNPISRTCQVFGSFQCGLNDGTTTDAPLLPETSTILSTTTTTTTTQSSGNVTDISRKYCPHIKTILDRMLRTIIRSVVAADGDCQKNCTLPTLQLRCG